ncbi:MAG TPA: DNA repair exonuclease [Desulfuromonadales bacterium]|nr:DNA repair exonuclease [Desulfuromonadales bacterium]
MFSFLHAADIHLDSPLKGLEVYQDAPLEQIRGAARRAFDNLVEMAIDEEVAFVLLAGDLYDGDWKDYNTGIYFVSRMGRLREAGIPVFMVSGNHDAASQITRSLNLPDNVTLFSHKKVETSILDHLGVAIHGQSFSSRAVTDDLTRNYPHALPGLLNIGLLHTSLNGRPNHEPYAPCTLDALRSKGYQYWALGHVHQREELSKGPWVVFPGNIQGRHIRETGAKGCTLVTVEDGQVVEVVARELDVLRWSQCQLDLGRCEKTESLLEMVRERFELERERADGRPLAIRLILDGATTLHARLHENSAHWHEEFRAVAATLGNVWIEKIIFTTRKTHVACEEFPDDSPIADLQKSILGFRLDSVHLLDLIPDFEQLRNKLPPDLLVDDDPFTLCEEELTALREDVTALLMAKMQQGGNRAN